MRYIDLHVHSSWSDGLLSPKELVAMASKQQLAAMALADHDSVAGIDEAISAGEAHGVEIIPAVELSISFRHYRDVHLLGYFINHRDHQFLNKLELFQERRKSRGLRIVEKINQKLRGEHKRPIDAEEVLAAAGGALGRPHVARVLVESGYARDIQDAFIRYLEPCDVPKEYFAAIDALAEIHRIGGLAVLAHPQSISRDRREMRSVIGELADLGLDGLEAVNSMGDQDDSLFLQRLARDSHLCVTGGSDFHGNGEGSALGYIREVRIGSELLTELKQTVERRATPS